MNIVLYKIGTATNPGFGPGTNRSASNDPSPTLILDRENMGRRERHTARNNRQADHAPNHRAIRWPHNREDYQMTLWRPIAEYAPPQPEKES